MIRACLERPFLRHDYLFVGSCFPCLQSFLVFLWVLVLLFKYAFPFGSLTFMSLSVYTSIIHTRSLSCNFDNNICTCQSKWIASVVNTIESIPLGSGLYTAQPKRGLIAPHIFMYTDEDEKGHCQILNPFVQPSLGDQSGDLHVRQANLYQHLGKDRVVRRFALLCQQHCRRLRVSLPGA